MYHDNPSYFKDTYIFKNIIFQFMMSIITLQLISYIQKCFVKYNYIIHGELTMTTRSALTV